MAPGQLPQPGNLNCRKDRQRCYFQQGPKVAFNSEKQLTDVSLFAARKLYVVFLELFLYSTQHVGSVSSCEFVNLFQHLPELNMNYGIAKSALCSFFYMRRKCMILWSKRNIYMLAVGKMHSAGIEPQKKYFPLDLHLYCLQTWETSGLSRFTWYTWFFSVPLLTMLAKILLSKTLLTKLLLA